MFSWSGQTIATDFLQIPSRGGHPCLWLYTSHCQGVLGTYTR